MLHGHDRPSNGGEDARGTDWRPRGWGVRRRPAPGPLPRPGGTAELTTCPAQEAPGPGVRSLPHSKQLDLPDGCSCLFRVSDTLLGKEALALMSLKTRSWGGEKLQHRSVTALPTSQNRPPPRRSHRQFTGPTVSQNEERRINKIGMRTKTCIRVHFSCGHTLGVWESLGQGWNPSLNYGNSGSSTR